MHKLTFPCILDHLHHQHMSPLQHQGTAGSYQEKMSSWMFQGLGCAEDFNMHSRCISKLMYSQRSMILWGANLLDLRHSRVCWSIEWIFHAISVYLHMWRVRNLLPGSQVECICAWELQTNGHWSCSNIEDIARLKCLGIILYCHYLVSEIWTKWLQRHNCDTWSCSGAWVY